MTTTLSDNPAGQITSSTRSNDAYAWTGAANVTRGYTTNGLNQYSAAGGTSLGYDAKGNLNVSGSNSYGYSQRNQLYSYVIGSTSGNLYYDPPGRLDLIYNYYATPNTTFDYDGDRLATEGTYGSTTVDRRYVFGAGTDEPLVWYEGSGTTDRRFLVADERGSIVAVTDASGARLAINTYDEYGIPGSGNMGRFQYTGQAWITELGMYYYKARIYSPTLGRFMQTDPIGYGDGMNWYNYVGSDPINWVDPSGLLVTCTGSIIPRANCGDIPGLSTIGGTWVCTNCGPNQTDPATGDIIVKAKDWVFTSNNSGYNFQRTSIITDNRGYIDELADQIFPISPPPSGGCPGQSDTVPMTVTAYTNGKESTGKSPGDPGYGLTSSGKTAGPGTIAADTRFYTYGTRMNVPGYGMGTVTDTGGAIKGGHIDLWMKDLSAAKKWGARKNVPVEVCK